MTDLHKAWTEIHLIRGQLARDKRLRGYGPVTVAPTGAVALLAAALQSRRITDPGRELTLYLTMWVATAAICLGMISVEALLQFGYRRADAAT